MQDRIEQDLPPRRSRRTRTLGLVTPNIGRSAREQYRHLYRRVGVTDALSIGLSLLVAYWIRFGLRAPSANFLALLVGTTPVMVAIFAGFRLYDAHRFTAAEEFRRLVVAISLGLSGVVTVSFWSRASFSREWLAVSWGLTTVLVLATRRLWHWHVWRARREGRLTFPTLIVGTNEEARRLEETMARPSFGFRPIGRVAEGTWDGSRNGLPVLGRVGELRELIRESGAECVFVAASALTVTEMGAVAKAVRLEGIEVRITASLPEVLSSRLSVQPFGGVMALSLKPVRLTGGQAIAKRAFDLVVSTVGLLVLSPFLVGMALAVRFSSPGPVLYRQRRIGHRGRPFTMLKFRTMENGAEAQVEELRVERGVADVMFKLPDDPRVTAVGQRLRRFSLDELPQLLNVVRGEMSLVGPRPPLPEEVAMYEDWQFDRLEVRPGITGLWQVSGRSELSFEECVRLDLFYIENWSLAYDHYIIAKTIPVLFSRRGAY
jgi:exopolysaccharide biosynthesis polyprenyl glycosylphosphotransferase